MKYNIILLFCLCAATIQAQQIKSAKQMEREATKIDTVFTVEERANLNLWFYEHTKKMKLSDTLEDKYYDIMYSSFFDMGRLNDKDKDYSQDEMQSKLDDIVKRTNRQVKDILSLDQYVVHLENFGTIVRSIYRKLDWD